MPTTSRGYPFPLDGAQPNVPYDMEALARALNGDVGAVDLLAKALKEVLDARTSAAGTPGALVSRATTGHFSVIDPTSAAHAAGKRYVDAEVANASRLTTGTVPVARLPAITYAMLAQRPWHVRTSAVAIPANGTVERVITFPSGRFDAAPIVQLSLSGYDAGVRVSTTDLSATRMTVVLTNTKPETYNVFVYISAFPEG